MIPFPPGRRALLLLSGSLFVLLVGYLLTRTSPSPDWIKSRPGSTLGTAISSTAPGSTAPVESKINPLNPGNAASAGNQPFTASENYPAALSIAGMQDEATRSEALEALMETWVSTQPEQAANWAGSLPAGTFRDDALSALMFHWGAQNPAAAAQWMTRTGVDDPEAASVLAGRWGQTDPSAAAGWAAALPESETRQTAISAIAASWAATSPLAAAAYADKLPPSDRTGAITAVLTQWADRAPAAAAAWLSNIDFPSPDEQSLALAALITPWASQSPSAVAKYINALPEGPAREAASSQFAISAAATAPAESLMWAMNIKDPVQRNQVVTDACEAWYDQSPDTFRSGIGEAIALMEDPTMRRGVYHMLYERDPAFQTNLLQMADQAPASPGPAAASVEPVTVSPVPAGDDPFAPAPGEPAPADPSSR